MLVLVAYVLPAHLSAELNIGTSLKFFTASVDGGVTLLYVGKGHEHDRYTKNSNYQALALDDRRYRAHALVDRPTVALG